MMILQLIDENRDLLNEIADFLLEEQLIANAMISDKIIFKERIEDTIKECEKYILKGISKSLLFNIINERLRNRYGEKAPLIYSEPIILIDHQQRDTILGRLKKV
ncbi:hypothetical protein [Marinirhabdus gelatinilytica]|uniref:Uncharacterized protein n=1 Tax=Marinirhabdus gelatinilytica TaxID=1703343 RepID=A0A370Q4H4_9FLAO|nr:hypothetical protein [Marinirhabdus gelatinilytica]RDK83263.1 hypothetical protein C8D94_10852 [Marinirhabdus gelatinilytica]